MSVDFTSRGRPATGDDIARLEDELRTILPRDYVSFLQTEGGGRPTPNQSVHDQALELGVAVTDFFDADHLTKEWSKWRARVPARLVPVADAEGGNLVCLSLHGEDTGSVYFWDHENEVEDGVEPDDRNITQIAASFEEFLDGLLPLGASGVDQPGEVTSAWIDRDFLASLRDGEN